MDEKEKSLNPKEFSEKKKKSLEKQNLKSVEINGGMMWVRSTKKETEK